MVFLACVGLAACDSGGDEETGASTEATDSTTGSATSNNPSSDTTSNPTATDSATGDGTGTSETTASPTSTDATEGATEGVTTDETTEGATTEGGICEGLGARECMASEQCMAIGGAPIEMSGEGACLGAREFLECQPATGCGDAITYACEGDDAQMYQFQDTCIPTDWVDCGKPPGGGDFPSCPE